MFFYSLGHVLDWFKRSWYSPDHAVVKQVSLDKFSEDSGII
jgi:hypothetical protein